MVYILDYVKCMTLTMSLEKVLLNPFNNVIFECPFDELMQKVWSEEFMNISTRKLVSEWLV